jgi:HemK-related putative methylase
MEVKPTTTAARDALLARLRQRLHAAGYGPVALRERLGVGVPDDVGLLNHAPACARLRTDRTAVAAAIRLFYLEQDEPEAALRTLLPAAEQTALIEAGLLAARAGRVRARLRLDAHGPLYLLADRRFRTPDRSALGLPRGDMVYPPGGDSALLADAVPARAGERVLDLCTGSGIQALAVAGRAAHVLAVDIGPRAAALARCNAALNGATNVEVRIGDLYAPMRTQRFDLILANPPFVPAPRRGPAYHSGGPRGDRVLRRVVAGLGAHLRDGGRAVVVSHLALRRGETVAAAIGPWLQRSDLRALALVLETGTPVDLAAAQAVFALDDGFAAYAREVQRWVAYLGRHRIAQVALLLVAAQRVGRAELEVVQAPQRILPLPLSRPPRELIAEWLTRS